MDSGVHGDGSKSPCSEMENDHRRSLVVAFYDLDESHFFQMFVAAAVSLSEAYRRVTGKTLNADVFDFGDTSLHTMFSHELASMYIGVGGLSGNSPIAL